MFERRIPEWLRHAPAPSIKGFAAISGFEAITRGMLISVFPVAAYDALQSASLVSSMYFMIGVMSLITGLLVPFFNKFIPRRVLYVTGALGYVVGSLCASTGHPNMVVFGLLSNTMATVVTFVCFNAYVLDYISRVELGKCETLRMFYSALGWTIGPVFGVTLWKFWFPLPFILSAVSAMFLLGTFLYMRLGNGKLISKAKAPAINPLAYLSRFSAQPRLIAGWMFAVIRSCGWWAYVVYLPIFSVVNGLGEQVGGVCLSITNAGLFCAPFMLRFVQRFSVKIAVRTGFLVVATMFISAAIVSQYIWATVAFLFLGSYFLILLDICGGLPFLMSVKPSERTEMSAIYSSFRDVSGILTPGVAWLILTVAPISGIFLASGLASLVAWKVAGTLHPRLGKNRLSPVL
jgi:ACDE family multidrug resistance protein